MAYRFRKIGVSIEGIIDDSEGLDDPTLIFTFKDDDTATGNAQLRSWLSDFPGRLVHSINPTTAGVNAGACDLELVRTDEISSLFFEKRARQVEIILAGDIDDIDTGFGVYSEANLVDVTRLYLGNETVYAPFGWSNVSGTLWEPASPLLRGAGGSKASEHSEGDRLKKLPPFMRGRRIKVGVYDVDGPRTSIDDADKRYFLWGGEIGSWRSDDQQTKVQIRTLDPLSRLSKVELGKDQLKYKPRGSVEVRQTLVSPSIHGTFEPVVDDLSPYDPQRHVRPEQEEIYLRINNTLVRGSKDGQGVVRVDGRPLMGSELPEAGLLEVDECHEVFPFNPGGELNFYQGSAPANALRDLPEGMQSAEYLAYMLGSGAGAEEAHPLNSNEPDNPLGETWRAGASWSYLWPWLTGDTTKKAPIPFGELDPVDQLIIGWDGPENAFEVIFKKILLPRGVAPCLQPMPDGLSVSLTAMDLAYYDADPQEGRIGPYNVEIKADKIPLDAEKERIKGMVKATLGETPWQSGNSQKIFVSEGHRGDDEPDSLDLDLSTYKKSLDDPTARVRLSDMVQKARNPLPLMTVSTPMRKRGIYGISPDDLEDPASIALFPGQVVRITNGPETGLIGPDGELVPPDVLESFEDVRFSGLVVSATIDVESWEQELRIMLTGWEWVSTPARLISPAVRVTALEGADHLAIADGELPSIRTDNPLPAIRGDDAHRVQFVDHRGRRIFPFDENLAVRTDPDTGSNVLYAVEGTLQEPAFDGEILDAIDRGLYVVICRRDDYENPGTTEGDLVWPINHTAFAHLGSISGLTFFDIYM